MKNKKMVKKIKIIAKGVAKKTGALIKKANKQSGKAVKALKKEWKKEAPQREELKKAGKKALEHGIKIGGDVVEVIRKDINEIRNRNKK